MAKKGGEAQPDDWRWITAFGREASPWLHARRIDSISFCFGLDLLQFPCNNGLTMVRRIFSPKLANKSLPLVRRIVADILARGRELRSLGHAEVGEGDTERELREISFGKLEEDLQSLLSELDSIGCSYKDFGFETGLVDFPGRIDGRSVLFCWRSDEESVGWYHEPAAGFAGRKRIPKAVLEAEEGCSA